MKKISFQDHGISRRRGPYVRPRKRRNDGPCFGERLRRRKSRDQGGSNKDAGCSFAIEKARGIKGTLGDIEPRRPSHLKASNSWTLIDRLERIFGDNVPVKLMG